MTFISSVTLLLGIFLQFKYSLKKINIIDLLILSLCLSSFFILPVNFSTDLVLFVFLTYIYSFFTIPTILKKNNEKVTMFMTAESTFLYLFLFWIAYPLDLYIFNNLEARAIYIFPALFVYLPTVIITLLNTLIYMTEIKKLRPYIELFNYLWVCCFVFLSILIYQNFHSTDYLNSFATGTMIAYAVILFFNLLLILPVGSFDTRNLDLYHETERAVLFRYLISLSFIDTKISLNKLGLLIFTFIVIYFLYSYLQIGFLPTLLIAQAAGNMLFLPERHKTV